MKKHAAAHGARFFTAHDLDRRQRRRRRSQGDRPTHERLEQRTLLSGVPTDASVADLQPVATGFIIGQAAERDDGVANSAGSAAGTTASTNFNIVASRPMPADLRPQLEAAVAAAQAALDRVVRRGMIDSILNESFGRSIADTDAFRAAVQQLRESWARGSLAIDVEVRPSADLQGHPAAYAASNADGAERIYVNAEWLATVGTASGVAAVLLEEFGHAIDRRINAGIDSPGDEGELFAHLVEGRSLDVEEIRRLVGEDDAGVLKLDGAAVAVEFAARNVTAVTIPDGTDGFFVVGDNVDVSVAFNGSVNVGTSGGTPTLTIRVGSSNRTASYSSGSGGSTLVFRYTIQSGDSDSDGISISSGSISLNGGTIKNGPDHATLSHAAVAANGNAKVYNGSRPTLTTMSTLTGATEDTAYEILYTALTAAGNEANANAFLIDSVTTGSLSKWNGTNWIAVTAGSTTVAAGEKLQWTPDANANGTLNAFAVKASNGTLASGTAVQVKVTVAAVNDPPTLTSIGTLTGATEDTPLEIDYATLSGASTGFADTEGSGLSYRIEAVSTGSLSKWNGSGWAAVTPGTTNLASGEKLQWTPAANANGTLNAFTVRAFDGH